MEDEAIVEGFHTLREGKEYDALYYAALSRERADWIVGINATRLFSTLYGQTLNIGRVMTPTLALVVEREKAITEFQVENFYTVMLEVKGIGFSSNKIKELSIAEKQLNNCKESSTLVVQNLEKKERQEKAPLLFDLTSLQRAANRKLGFTAQQTLDYAQSLYEKKLITYPRTDSRYLTEDMKAGVERLVGSINWVFNIEPCKDFNVLQVINNKKVSDHHAILPTARLKEVDIYQLPTGEREILYLLAGRVLEAIAIPFKYKETIVEAGSGEILFTAKGKEIIEYGWKSILSDHKDKDEMGS